MESITFADDEKISLIQEILMNGVHVRIRVTGGSMEPFLSSGDTVVMKNAAPQKLCVGDLVFFMDQNHQPVLHRLIRKKTGPDGNLLLQTKGDFLAGYDQPFAEDQFLGKVYKIEKRGRKKKIYLESLRNRAMGYGTACFHRLRVACRTKLLLLWKPV